MTGVDIAFLANRLDLAPALAAQHAAEWRHLYADWDESAALAEFRAQRGDGGWPVTLLALAGAELLGSISVVENDLPGCPDLNPWVASFRVGPDHRGRGVGRSLLRAAEDLLRRNGVARAYLFTEGAAGYFRARGWTDLRPALANGCPVQILSRSLPTM